MSTSSATLMVNLAISVHDDNEEEEEDDDDDDDDDDQFHCQQ